MFNDEEIIGLADAIDKAVDDYFAKQKSKVEECHKKLGKEDYTLKDLEQKLINSLYKKQNYNDLDIEIIKILFK